MLQKMYNLFQWRIYGGALGAVPPCVPKFSQFHAVFWNNWQNFSYGDPGSALFKILNRLYFSFSFSCLAPVSGWFVFAIRSYTDENPIFTR